MKIQPFLERIGIVFQKEVLDNLRDKRTVRTALLTPLLGPLIFAVIITVQVKTISEKSDEALKLPIIGSQNAPHLIAYLRQAGVEIVAAPPDPEAKVRDGTYAAVLRVPKGYGEDFQKARPATVQVIADSSRQSNQVSTRRVRDLLNGYGRQVGALRLVARGINPSVIQAIALEDIDVGAAQGRAASLLAMLPYFIIFSAFIGGLYIAIDTTAGERERGSLEPLVINPVPRWELVLGKVSATLLFAMIAVAETIVGFAVMLNYVPVEELGLQFNLSPLSLLGVLLVALPILPVAAGIQTIVATFTKSFREALTYLQLLPLIPALPGLLLVFVPVKPELWVMLIPTFGQQILIQQLLRGEVPNGLLVAVSTLTTLAIGAILIWGAIWIFQREEVLGR
ncbi:ABC transporter permease [Anthocerotibacter panamensis]|uniref:ABC transporter permease n=1 Tax=Anthocerotibacter panamensis TaxID=2857077 RepID=UPI001C404E67|nr:ABC transporter permease [Anthocerotibacter panamensis]